MGMKGGDALKAKLEEIARKVGRANTVDVGFLDGATYPDVEGGLIVAAVAAIQEYGGTVTIPEHTTTINRKIDKSGNFVGGYLEKDEKGESTGVRIGASRFVKAGSANYQTQHTVPEYTVTIPARPYFRGMIAANKGEWGPQLGKMIKATGYDSSVALGQLGELVQGQLIQSIRDLKDPPNAKSTIAKKGSSNPLVDSGMMVGSTGYKVNE
jgi:hypothetical protein